MDTWYTNMDVYIYIYVCLHMSHLHLRNLRHILTSTLGLYNCKIPTWQGSKVTFVFGGNMAVITTIEPNIWDLIQVAHVVGYSCSMDSSTVSIIEWICCFTPISQDHMKNHIMMKTPICPQKHPQPQHDRHRQNGPPERSMRLAKWLDNGK